MRTVKEVSRLTGVSVRTLHHYDAIGLLKPTEVTGAGYRLYDDTALGRLQSILLFRELQFPLKEIKAILDSPDFDLSEALEQQIQLLELQKKHIGELISFAREIQKEGGKNMDFHIFDKSEIEKYKEEARQKWGGTKAYEEFEQRAESADSGHGTDEGGRRIMDIFAKIGAMRQKNLPPAHKDVQEKIRSLQNLITDSYYTCTPAILKELGQMYVNDQRFRQNIDRTGGEGTATFTKQAIEVYCADM